MKTLKLKIKKIIQDSHDCAEWGCWEGHQESINLIIQVFEQLVREKKKVLTSNKVYCDCDCESAFCNNLVHQCHKPDEHYPQIEQVIIDVQNGILDDLLEALKV